MYCTIDEARAELLATPATVADDRFMRYVSIVSRRVNQIMIGKSNYFYFEPNIEARTFALSGRNINSWDNSFALRDAPPLLSFSSVLADGSDVTSVTEGFPHEQGYYRQVRITSSGSPWYCYVSACDPAYVVITGVCGYHSDYANAWLSVDALSAQITAGATSFTVSDIDGDDPYGFAPRISRGNVVRFGTGNDIALVTDTNTSTNTATIKRNWNGGTGAIEVLETAVYVWQVEEPIKRVVARQAAMMVARQGAFQSQEISDLGTVSYPSDLLRELNDVLTEYMNGD